MFDFLKKKNPAIETRPVLPQEIYEAGVLELQDVIAPSAFKVSPKEINLGEKIVRTFFVISYPRYLTESWFSPLINLDKVFNISIFVHPIETEKILRTFQKKVAEVQSQIHMREEKGMVRDPMLDTAYQDLEKLRDDLQQAQEKIFDVGLYISVFADDETELNKLESELKTILESRLVYVKPALFQQEQGFASVLPIADDRLLIHSKLNSSPLSSLFPFISFDLTSDRGILYGINRHNSSLILFDRFSLENYNSITFAKSGSGKSVRGNEPVLVREEGKIKLCQIENVVEKTIKKHGITYRDEELEGVYKPNLEVFSFDKELKGRWSKVSVAARKIAPDNLYKFTTRSGREITTTGDHNMVIIKKGEVTVAKSDNVFAGEYVPVPRQIAWSDEKTNPINVLEMLKKERLIYVTGASGLINKNYEGLKDAEVDKNFDFYLYKYRNGRRIPVGYFLKILKTLGISADEKLLASLRIMSKSGKYSMPAILPMSESLQKILGYIAAEGTIKKKVVIISNTEKEVIKDIKSAFSELKIPCYEVSRAVATAFPPFVKLIHRLGGNGYSAEKKVAPFIFNTSPKLMAAYLSAYFEGDGGIDGMAITAVSKSKQLISEIAYLLLFFGIIGRVKMKKKIMGRTGRKINYWHISISGQDNLTIFAKDISFVTERKKAALGALLGKNPNTNVDLIPEIKELAAELYEIFGSGVHNFQDLAQIRDGKRLPSPEKLAEIASELRKRVAEIKELKETLSLLSRLPNIETIIKLAETDKKLNQKMWELLGSSWAAIKSRQFAPQSQNALTAIGAVYENAPADISEIKNAIHLGCSELDIEINRLNPSLGPALRNENANTSYSMIQKAAAFVSKQYYELLNKLPRVEEIISQFELLCHADLFWDEITDVTKIENKSDKYVYDLTVDDGVFVAGNAGMFVHNSYATKLEILRSLMFDIDIIVMDPEREYEYMATATGGKYFNISLTSEHHINPFELPAPREDELPADVLRSHIVNLVGLFRIMMGGLTAEEDAITDRAITETYALKDITAESDFGNVEPPLMSDFELVLAGMEGGELLVQRLTKYTRGTWAGFINKPSNVSIDGRFVVFSLRDMEDELKPVAMYIVMHFIWNAIRKNLKKRLLVIDEAWWMMKSEDTASFLLGLAKRGRKYYLGLSTITQDVDDFLKSPYGLPIITNSSIQMLLKQSPSSIDKIQQVFNLTDEEKFLLLESDVGEGIFFAGLKHVAIKGIASYTEDQIITSDPSQILAIKKAREDLSASQ